MASSGGSPFYIPSYLDDSDGNADFKHLADTFSPSGPLRFRDAVDGHVVSKADMKWVLRFKATGVVTIPVDAELPNERIPDGAEIAVVNLSDGRVVIQPEAGVLVGGDERLVVNPWKVGVLVKNGANFWLLSLGNGTGGDSKNVPLPPENVKAFGAPASVVVSWDAPKDDGGSAITSYIVQQKKGTDFVDVKTTQDRYVQVDGLEVGTSYSFRVKAVNAVGFSEPSAEVSATPTKEFNDATGGTITQYEKDGKFFRVHTFTSSGQLNVTKAANPFRVLVVGGGGRGGSPRNGEWPGKGGGNGGQVVDKFVPLAVGTNGVTIGPGDQDSSIADVVAKAAAGAAGGPCGVYSDGTRGSDGPTSDITGTVKYYAGGGGGGADQNHAGSGPGGNAGGGTGGIGGDSGRDPGDGSAGAANTGGGGGGGGAKWDGRQAQSVGGPGGSGIVVVSYEIAPFNNAEGGIEKTIENYNGTGQKWKTHTFTAGGTFKVNSGARPFRVLCIASGSCGASNSKQIEGGFWETGGFDPHGGSGGQVIDKDFLIPEGSHEVQIGAGTGAALACNNSNSNPPPYIGSPSSLGGIVTASGPSPALSGTKSNITGADVFYSGQGQRSSVYNAAAGGSPSPGTAPYTPGGAGTPNTGGGGASGLAGTDPHGEPSVPGNGGSGLVIVAYQIG